MEGRYVGRYETMFAQIITTKMSKQETMDEYARLEALLNTAVRDAIMSNPCVMSVGIGMSTRGPNQVPRIHVGLLSVKDEATKTQIQALLVGETIVFEEESIAYAL